MTTTTLPQREAGLEFVRRLAHDHAGLALVAEKDSSIESRLAPLIRQQGLATLDELVEKLRSLPFGDLHMQVIEAMATIETSFFRDGHPFEALKKDVLPRLIAARQAVRTLTIWSAGCSTGQEPYSIAIVLAEHFATLATWNIQIHATDLSRQALARASAGEYTQRDVHRGLPVPLLVKHFDLCDLKWQIRPEIRQRVTFERLNLIDPWPLPTFDIVFLRNVLIYFTPVATRQILADVKRQVAPDGVLFLGGAETTLGIDDDWQRVWHGKTASYRLASGRA